MATEIYPALAPGDIGAIRGRGLGLWACQNLIKPKTDRFHFFLVGGSIPWDNDYVILESIGKGIAVGRLSFYKWQDVEIYRVVHEDWEELGERAAAALTLHGRARYDYILILEIALGALSLLLRGKLPPWEPKQFPYGRDKAFICTEAARLGWLTIGHPILMGGVVPVPATYMLALQEGRIKRIFPAPPV